MKSLVPVHVSTNASPGASAVFPFKVGGRRLKSICYWVECVVAGGAGNAGGNVVIFRGSYASLADDPSYTGNNYQVDSALIFSRGCPVATGAGTAGDGAIWGQDLLELDVDPLGWLTVGVYSPSNTVTYVELICWFDR